MKIGITFDLRSEYLEMGFSEEETAEFDSEETLEAIENTLRSLSHEVDRIGNIYELAKRLSSGHRWDLVFNISEGLYGRNRESQVPALLEAFNIPYTFSDALTLAICLDKSKAKIIARNAGIPTPEFYLISSEHDLASDEITKTGDFPLFAKPVAEGTGKGITGDSIVYNHEEMKRQCRKLLLRYNQPVLVEKFLPGSEYTVGILGTGSNARVIGIMEVSLLKNAEPQVYSYMNKELCEERIKYKHTTNKKTVSEASAIALSAFRAFDCRDAGRVDLRADSMGRLNFLEINPLAGLHPTHSDLPILCSMAGISYKDLLNEIVLSASVRHANEKERRLPGIMHGMPSSN